MSIRARVSGLRVLVMGVCATWSVCALSLAQGESENSAEGSGIAGPALEPLDTAESETYKITVERAIAAFRLRDLDSAQRLFSEAHGMLPSARTLRGLGVVAFERGRYVQAADYLEQALHSSVRPLDADLRESCSALLNQAQDRIGHLQVLPRPADARVLVDGEHVAVGLPIRLAAGPHTLELRRAGYRAERRELLVEGRAEKTLELELRPVLPPAVEPPADRADVSRGRWYRSPWLWSAVAVVALGSGTAMVVAWAPRKSELHGGSTGTVVGR